jgi:hypothetical protein
MAQLPNGGHEAGPDVEIADALVCAFGIMLELGHDLPQYPRITNWSSGNHSDRTARNIAHKGVLLFAEPVLNSGIEDLICDRVPAMGENELPRK